MVNGFVHDNNPWRRPDVKLNLVLFLSRQLTILSDIYENNCYQSIKKTFVWHGDLYPISLKNVTIFF